MKRAPERGAQGCKIPRWDAQYTHNSLGPNGFGFLAGRDVSRDQFVRVAQVHLMILQGGIGSVLCMKGTKS